MKMVVGYVDRDRVDRIREELLEQGFLSLSVLDASGTTPEVTMSGTYRGAVLERHLRPKARVECVLGDEYAEAVSGTIVEIGGQHAFVVVLPVEQAFPVTTVKLSEEAVPAG
jgi:nitrogen regulatory protein PII